MKTNIEILENLSINHKKLKEDKPYLLFKILKAMDIARTEQLTLTDVSNRDLYQELRAIGLTHDACSQVLDWSKTIV